MNQVKKVDRKVLKKKSIKGQSMAEYALIIALVAIALIGALQFLTGGISAVFTGAGEAMNDASGDTGGGGAEL